MTRRCLLSLQMLSSDELMELLNLVQEIAAEPNRFTDALRSKTIGLLFSVPSTRTRSSFWRAALDLSAHVINFAPGDLQLSTGEPLSDTARVLSNAIDALAVRTNGPIEQMKEIARYIPATVNAMSDLEHPTQALADYATICEHFGSAEGLTLSYFGEGNNTANALALLFAAIPGVTIHFFTPSAYPPDSQLLRVARERSEKSGSRIFVHHDVVGDRPRADIIYTTRWQTMGAPHAEPDWRRHFWRFQVNHELFERFASPRAIFMHDLPAVRGEEVTGSVLDGPHSLAWRQAHHKISSAKASLLWSLGVNGNG